ncbi:hypothetical protein ACE6H2_015792 [Prunus campanulata]
MSQMREFGEALDNCGLKVINYTGYKFTWQGEGNIKLRLDTMEAKDEMLLGGECGTVVDKIMSCQTSLLSWNMEKVGLIPKKIRGVQDKLNAIRVMN